MPLSTIWAHYCIILIWFLLLITKYVGNFCKQCGFSTHVCNEKLYLTTHVILCNKSSSGCQLHLQKWGFCVNKDCFPWLWLCRFGPILVPSDTCSDLTLGNQGKGEASRWRHIAGTYLTNFDTPNRATTVQLLQYSGGYMQRARPLIPFCLLCIGYVNVWSLCRRMDLNWQLF